MKREVRLEVIYPHPPERVWRALTARRALAKWLMPNDFEPRLGHKFRFTGARREGDRDVIECEVITLDAPCRLAYTWRHAPDETPSIVIWTLEPVAAGTRLRLEHRGSDDATATIATATAGWTARLDAV